MNCLKTCKNCSIVDNIQATAIRSIGMQYRYAQKSCAEMRSNMGRDIYAKTAIQSKKQLKYRDASDERQYMLSEDYEVYEKIGEPVGAVAFHYHNFYELIYIMDGEFSSLIEDRAVRMRKGDFLLIDKNVMHKYHPTEKKLDSSRRIILWISEQMLKELAQGETFLTDCFAGEGPQLYHFPIYYEEILRGFLLKLAMSEILEGADAQNVGLRKVMDRGYLSLFFGYLNVLCRKNEYLSSTQEIVDHPLVEQVTCYVDEHIGEDISVEDVAQAVHMSKYYFLRKFKEITGMTVHNFIVNKRIISACRMLGEGRSITECWQQNGFSDYSSFLRNFRKIYGISPKEYRETR